MITKLKYGNTNTYFVRENASGLLIDTQTEYIHFADELSARDHRTDYKPIRERNAIILRCEDSRDFLALNLGIKGEIISTASHSEDSIAVILDDGNCIVGDLEPSMQTKKFLKHLSLPDQQKQPACCQT